MKYYEDKFGDVYDEDFLWDIFIESCEDYSDEEFARYLEENGFVEV